MLPARLRLRRIVVPVATVALTALAFFACHRDTSNKAAESREPASVATIHSAELEVPATRGPDPAAISTVDVGDDRAVFVVVGEGAKAKQPIIHLTGMCTDAKSDLEAWSSTVRNYGTIIALEGDLPCPDGRGGRSWSMDPAKLDARIDTAMKAVHDARGVALEESQVIVIGESMGATRATSLAARSPEKYARLVLIGSAEKLDASRIGEAKAVAVLAGEEEPQEIPQQNFDALSTAGTKSKFWTLTGAPHGEYGPNGAATMNEALAFVTGR